MSLFSRITVRDRALFYEHISNLVEGGVTVMKAVKTFVAKGGNPLFTAELEQLLTFIESGDSFSTSMKKLPRVFWAQEVAIVEAGEQSGGLQKSLSSLGQELRAQEDLISKVKGALTYPAIVFIFLALALVAVMIYVVPKMMPLFAWAKLPAITASLIAVSDFLRTQYYIVFIVGALSIIAYRAWASTDAGAFTRDELLLKIPLVGTLLRNYLIVRGMSTMALLIGSGIPILKTFELTSEAVGNRAFQKVFMDCRSRIAMGKKITESMEESDANGQFFPIDIVQMVSAGEATSSLNTTCARISHQYQRELDYSIANLVKFVEPAAVLIAGIFVTWFAVGIFSAILQIVGNVDNL